MYAPLITPSGSGETPLPDIVPNYLVLLQRKFSAFAAYWKSGASGPQNPLESQDITPAHSPLPCRRSKPPSKTSRTTGATDSGERRAHRRRGRRWKHRLGYHRGPRRRDGLTRRATCSKAAPKSIRSKAGAKALTSPTKPKKSA